MLTYLITRNESLVDLKTLSDSKLELRFNAVPLKTPHLTEVHVENSGSKPIEIDSYTDGFEGFGKGLLIKAGNSKCRILACTVINMNPPSRPLAEIQLRAPSLDSDETSDSSAQVFLRAVALNPRDSIDLRIISDGSPMPLSIWGHISNCVIQQTTGKPEFKPTLNLVSTVFLFTGATLGFICFAILVCCFFTARSILNWTLKTTASVFGAIGKTYREASFGVNVRTKAETPERARELILSPSEFTQFAENVEAKTADEREKVRSILLDMIGPTDSSPRARQPETVDAETVSSQPMIATQATNEDDHAAREQNENSVARSE